MNIHRESCVCCLGKAEAGKTFWIIEHLKALPTGKAFIFDFNQNDFTEFQKSQNLWMNQTGLRPEFEGFLKMPYAQGNCIVVMEEADNYLKYPDGFIRRFVTTARNRGIGMIVSCKRAKSIHPDYRGRFTHLILFHNDLIDDIEYIQDWIGCSRDTEKSNTLEKTLRGLALRGEYIEVDMVNSTISEVKKL